MESQEKHKEKPLNLLHLSELWFPLTKFLSDSSWWFSPYTHQQLQMMLTGKMTKLNPWLFNSYIFPKYTLKTQFYSGNNRRKTLGEKGVASIRKRSVDNCEALIGENENVWPKGFNMKEWDLKDFTRKHDTWWINTPQQLRELSQELFHFLPTFSFCLFLIFYFLQPCSDSWKCFILLICTVSTTLFMQ